MHRGANLRRDHQVRTNPTSKKQNRVRVELRASPEFVRVEVRGHALFIVPNTGAPKSKHLSFRFRANSPFCLD